MSQELKMPWRPSRSTDPEVGDILGAARDGDVALIREQLESGADPDLTDRRGRTALLIASQAGHHRAVAALLAGGADIDRQDLTCLNPFLFGCISGDLELVRMALAAGADLSRLTRFGGNGLTPASEKGHVEVVRELLQITDINVNHTNYLGWTALLEAIVLGDGGPRHQAVVALLLQHGADPSLADKHGVLPLELAQRHGHREIEAILTERG